MRFYSRKLIKPEDLNPNHTLFGGSLLRWIDEEAAIFAICQLQSDKLVTKFISEINFINSAKAGDIIEMGMEILSFGTTSVTFKCEVRNKFNKNKIITIDKIVFVHVDENGRPKAHGITSEREPEEDQAYEPA
ncbi:hotdog domain-containing protein [Cyclonatronum sp.]|uniref:acyl-CoA thioesterase n=1 Tax=Cyclonatronum sp. TaxID=3024185 RepID=UPI0025BB9DDE|nr:hotdog domain-containing protein [Cyclonatronum sp.]MCC5933478.1 acyl-CoA thioesterase [Balneolales bacterium]